MLMTRMNGKTHTAMQYNLAIKSGKTYCEKTINQRRVVYHANEDCDLECQACQQEMNYWAKVSQNKETGG